MVSIIIISGTNLYLYISKDGLSQFLMGFSNMLLKFIIFGMEFIKLVGCIALSFIDKKFNISKNIKK
ncbi:MAG: hypothetical protein OCD02_03375 [Spirochaetaceae bacterium]